MESFQIRGFFWSVFSCIQSDYRKIQIRKNSVPGHFSRSQHFGQKWKNYQNEGVRFDLFLVFFLSGFSFMNIHESQDSKGSGQAVALTPLYQFQPLHRHLDISRVITAKSSPLHKASSRIRTENLPNANHSQLNYAPLKILKYWLWGRKGFIRRKSWSRQLIYTCFETG